MEKVVLIVPDSGPLISLAKGNSLNLLLKLNIPIYITDQVYYETTKDTRFQDAIDIRKFIEDNPNVINIFETLFGKIAAQERKDLNPKRQPGIGEASISEFMARLDEVTGDSHSPALLLFEDTDIQKSKIIIPSHVHLLSTKGLLVGLEQNHVIKSANDIWEKMNSNGRHPSEDVIDTPGIVDGKPTKWR